MKPSPQPDPSDPGSPAGPTTASFPARLGAVDVGSNAIRALAAEFRDTATYEVLEELRLPVRLGHESFRTGLLAPDVMDAAVNALASVRRRFDALGLVRCRGVATSAVRESRNAVAFLHRVRRDAGISVEAITAAEEARLVHTAVRHHVDLADRRWVLADLGGGSVEISIIDRSGILWSESYAMGAVRLLETLEASDAHEPSHRMRLLARYVDDLRLPPAAQDLRPDGLIATGGNIEALARLADPGVPEFGRTPIVLGLDALRRVMDTLAHLTWQERIERLGLRPDRADVIVPAAAVYERIAVLAGASEILVPRVGVREGLLLELAASLVPPGGVPSTPDASHAELYGPLDASNAESGRVG